MGNFFKMLIVISYFWRLFILTLLFCVFLMLMMYHVVGKCVSDFPAFIRVAYS